MKKMAAAAEDANDADHSLLPADSTAEVPEGYSELESALRLANEKNRNFLARMKDLTQTNRSISDRNKELKQENDRLKSELALSEAVTERLKAEVDECRSDKSVVASLKDEIEELHEQIHQNGVTITKLTTACEEKDRRIDLLTHRKHRRQKGRGCSKDGCDGYRSSDSPSLDSESSASVATAAHEVQCEDLFLAEDFQHRYRRLLSEKLALERVHSEAQLLVLQLKNENRDYQNQIKLLTKSLHEFKEQLLLAEDREQDLRVKLEEFQTENEHLEFQILEMEVQREEELEHGCDPKSPESSREQRLSQISSSPEVPTDPWKLGPGETAEAQTEPGKSTDRAEISSDKEFRRLHAATPKLEDLDTDLTDDNENLIEDEASVSAEEMFSRLPSRNSKAFNDRLPESRGAEVSKSQADGGDNGLDGGRSFSGGISSKKSEKKVRSKTSRTHIEPAFTGLDKGHRALCPSESAGMITPPEGKTLKSRHLNSTDGSVTLFSDDFDIPDKSLDSDDSFWANIEDPATAVDLGSGKSNDFWREVEERMGFNVDDITVILEFEDTFPSEVDDASARLSSQGSVPSSDHDNDSLSLPPPLPLSLPPTEVKRNQSPNGRPLVEAVQDFGDTKGDNVLQVEVMESQLSDVVQENEVKSSTADFKLQSKSDLTLLETTSGGQFYHSTDGFHDNEKDVVSYESEIGTLKRQIVNLEKELSASQQECLTVVRAKENLAGDFERVKKIGEERDREMKSLQQEFEKLLNERNSQIAAEADRSRVVDSSTQTTDGGNFAKLEQLLQAKDRELIAKANEVDNLSREMREWQRKVTVATEKEAKTTELIDSVRKELESMTEKEQEARVAVEEGLEREKRLQVERERLEESVANLGAEVQQSEAIVREKEILERKMHELEHNLRLKTESESSLLREIGSLRLRVDDLQSSLKVLQAKEWDFETLEQKYKDLGNLTRCLQTAVAPMKARIARLALRCKTKDELIRTMLKALHRHSNGDALLDAEVERELKGASTDDYTRPLSPLTISHLDQINHEILKLDLLSNDEAFPSLHIPPNAYSVFGEFPGNVTAHDTADNIRHTGVMSGSRMTREVDDKPPNRLSISSRRHVTLLDSGDFDDVTLGDRTRTEKVSNDVTSLDYRSSLVAKISKELEAPRFSTGKGHDVARFLHEENTHVENNASDGHSADVFIIPEPPADFHVQKVSGNGSVLLGWTPPVMDDMRHGHGCSITGYKVYVNGRETLFVSGQHAAKALLKSLNLNAVPLRFTLCTVAENGNMSRPVDLYLDDVLLKKCQTDDFAELALNDDMAVSSATSSPSRHDVNGRRKMFLAIYDYHPSAVTRVEGQGAELSFQTGDIIVTCGPMRSDGYYVGKVRGRRGLVPGSFIEELAPFTSQDVKIVAGNGRPLSGLILTNGIHPRPRRSRSLGTGLNMPQSEPA